MFYYFKVSFPVSQNLTALLAGLWKLFVSDSAGFSFRGWLHCSDHHLHSDGLWTAMTWLSRGTKPKLETTSFSGHGDTMFNFLSKQQTNLKFLSLCAEALWRQLMETGWMGFCTFALMNLFSFSSCWLWLCSIRGNLVLYLNSTLQMYFKSVCAGEFSQFQLVKRWLFKQNIHQNTNKLSRGGKFGSLYGLGLIGVTYKSDPVQPDEVPDHQDI